MYEKGLYNNSSNCAGQIATAVELPIARRVLNRNEQLASDLHATAEHLAGRLESITGRETCEVAKDSPMPPKEFFPPLFDEFRSTQDSMTAALARIHQLLDRIEL